MKDERKEARRGREEKEEQYSAFFDDVTARKDWLLLQSIEAAAATRRVRVCVGGCVMNLYKSKIIK